jgi:two-component system, cell cycle response regulator DivK
MSKLILVVDDYEDNLQILRDLLGSADFNVIERRNGEAALIAAKLHRPDLIVMDIQLPIMDGCEATRRIRSDPDLKSIPVIAVTSCVDTEEELKLRAAGCSAYVGKPYSPRQLLALIKQLLI